MIEQKADINPQLILGKNELSLEEKTPQAEIGNTRSSTITVEFFRPITPEEALALEKQCVLDEAGGEISRKDDKHHYKELRRKLRKAMPAEQEETLLEGLRAISKPLRAFLDRHIQSVYFDEPGNLPQVNAQIEALQNNDEVIDSDNGIALVFFLINSKYIFNAPIIKDDFAFHDSRFQYQYNDGFHLKHFGRAAIFPLLNQEMQKYGNTDSPDYNQKKYEGVRELFNFLNRTKLKLTHVGAIPKRISELTDLNLPDTLTAHACTLAGECDEIIEADKQSKTGNQFAAIEAYAHRVQEFAVETIEYLYNQYQQKPEQTTSTVPTNE